ncbi:MAG: RHS repeat-associated core domain-containing protein [Acidobacteriia bacterium]|nr:RHS repeat-associated core domain-containing protein [Terriglobia bacterium]
MATFTGKERDSESGLDYFGARYHGSSLGRFVTPDPLLSSGRPWAPQTWNRYAYSQNNPLRYVDPSGLYDYDANCKEGSAGSACRQDQQRFDKVVAKREIRGQTELTPISD